MVEGYLLYVSVMSRGDFDGWGLVERVLSSVARLVTSHTAFVAAVGSC